jgi:hypothetical protein
MHMLLFRLVAAVQYLCKERKFDRITADGVWDRERNQLGGRP